jgi:hypothetical protein
MKHAIFSGHFRAYGVSSHMQSRRVYEPHAHRSLAAFEGDCEVRY